MTTLRVGQLRARYRVPAAPPEARRRLDEILHGLVDDALEEALSEAGVPATEEICIRNVSVPVRLGLGSPDSALSRAWGNALASSIRKTVEVGGPNIARYANRAHALADMLACLAAGDYRRAWAWRQLGIWGLGDDPPPAAAADQAVRALLGQPDAITATVASVAEEGGLPALVRLIPPGSWLALAEAASAAASVTPSAVRHLVGWASRPVNERDSLESPDPDVSRAETGPVAETARAEHDPRADDLSREWVAASRIVRTSLIARAIGGVPAPHPEVRAALRILALLEAEPSLLSGPAEKAARVFALLREVAVPRRSQRRQRVGSTGLDDAAAARPSGREQPTEPSLPTSGVTASSADRPGGTAPRTDTSPSAEVLQPEVGEGSPELPLPALPPAARTEGGGLLFLLHLVESAGILEAVANGAYLSSRGLRWVLHQLAMRLLDLPADDPAALAFAGLAPDRAAPSLGEADATREEEEELALFADRLMAAFRERLARSGAQDVLDPLPLLRRDAHVVASPGWIDVVLDLEQTDIDIRRAGLDLDPGWLPWLGVVVRFVYEQA